MTTLRVCLLGLLLCAAPSVMIAVWAEPPSKDHTPNGPKFTRGDEQFLLQMRNELGGQAPAWGSAPAEKQEQWFREGLQQAVHQPSTAAPERQPWPAWPTQAGPSVPPVNTPPVQNRQRWRKLLEASSELGRIANDLDQHGFWDQSDAVREAAGKLRTQARKLAEGDSAAAE